MAEFIFKDMLRKNGLENAFFVSSCATSTEEVGNRIYPPARRELARRKVPFDDHRAVQLTYSDYDKYDLFVCMEDSNIRGITRIFGQDKMDKVHKLLDFADGGNVADPWYTDDFDTAFNDISRGCEGLLKYLVKRGER